MTIEMTFSTKQASMRAYLLTSMGWMVTVVILNVAWIAVEPTEAIARADNTIVAPDSALELIYTRQAKLNSGLTEGPAVAADGSIYFTDMPFGTDSGMILRYDPIDPVSVGGGGMPSFLAEHEENCNGSFPFGPMTRVRRIRGEWYSRKDNA